MNSLPMTDLLSLSPLLAMVVLFFVLLVLDLIVKEVQKVSLLWITAGGMFLIAGGSLAFRNALLELQSGWGGLVHLDATGLVMVVLISAATGLTALFASEEETLKRHGEFPLMLVAAGFGLALMTVSTNLVMLYLAMEMAGIPLYILAGMLIYNRFSTEAGLKYLLYGAMASAVMLYGFSLLLGLTGTTSFEGIKAALQSADQPGFTLIVAFLFILAGFGYKIAAAPFHFWAPDVYTGAPTPVSGYLSTASKAAGFVVLMRFLTLLAPSMGTPIRWTLAALAVLSMLLGNLLAMQQKNLKRLLAYSSIAHAGYLLVTVAAVDAESTAGILFYLTGYLFTNLAAFALVTAASRLTGSEELSGFSGLSRKHPSLALLFLIVFLSLAGIPPFAGFAGKVFVFLAAAKSGLSWLVVIGLLNSVMALFYYLNVLKVIYSRPVEEGAQAKNPQPLSLVFKAALVVCGAAILYFGIIYLPWYNLMAQAGKLLWS